MSMDLSKVSEIVTREGYPLMLEAYDRHPKLYPEYCEVVPGSDDILLGDKGEVITGLGDLQEREDGADIEHDEFKLARTWYMKTHQFSRMISFSERQLKAAEATGRVRSLVRQMASSWGNRAALQKDLWAGNVLQKGTLTAGSVPYFGGSFIGQTDPYPGFIYDGLPFFDTAHTQAIGGNTFSNHVAGNTLTHANLITARQTMTDTNAKDDRNARIYIRPNTLIVPPALEDEARVILESDKLSGSAQNDANVNRNAFNLIVNPFLEDSATGWYLAEAKMGLRFYDWGEPVLRTWYDESKKLVCVSAETYWGMVVTDWRYWYCGGKAAA